MKVVQDRQRHDERRCLNGGTLIIVRHVGPILWGDVGGGCSSADIRHQTPLLPTIHLSSPPHLLFSLAIILRGKRALYTLRMCAVEKERRWAKPSQTDKPSQSDRMQSELLPPQPPSQALPHHHQVLEQEIKEFSGSNSTLL